MTRSAPTIPFAMVDSEPQQINFDWCRLEKAYGHTLPPAVRDDLSKATTLFVYFECFERAAKPRLLAKEQIKARKEAAQNLIAEVFPLSPDEPAVYANHIIGNKPLKRLRNDLLSFARECNRALGEMNQQQGHSQEGDCWNNWIRSLDNILGKQGLPIKVSKNLAAATSPFVSLVNALQDCIPSEARRHRSGTDALANAICRARRGQKGRQKL